MAVIGPADSRVVAVTGDDRLSHLDAMTTQRLGDLPPGQGRSTLVLEAGGKLLGGFDVIASHDDAWLLVPEPSVDLVMETIATRTFLADARFAMTDHVVWSVRGDDVHGVLGALGFPSALAAWRDVDGARIWNGTFGVEIAGPSDVVADVVAQLVEHGVEQVDSDGLEQARIAAGEPVVGREVAAPHLPEELGLLPTHVHLSKGCYPGQEAVSRMWMLGRPRRQLALVDVGADVAAGDVVGDKPVTATVTAVAGDRALAFVPVGTPVGTVIGEGVAAVRRIVGDDRPVVGWDPSQTRGRDRRASSGVA